MIRITAGTVTMSEQTLRELVRAVEKAKDEIEFTDEPMPNEDMETKQFIHEQARRGKIRVESPASEISFVVELCRKGGKRENPEPPDRRSVDDPLLAWVDLDGGLVPDQRPEPSDDG